MASVWREVWEVHITVIQLIAALPTCYDTICLVHGQNRHGLLHEIYTTRGDSFIVSRPEHFEQRYQYNYELLLLIITSIINNYL